MKHRIIRIWFLLGFTFIPCSVLCQEKKIVVGNQCPDFELKNVMHYSLPDQHVSDLNGKIVVLDFWDTYCGTCIASMPKIDSLRRKYKGDAEFFLVTWESKEAVLNRVKQRFPKKYQMAFEALPVIYSDTILKQYFPHEGIPHVVWIGRDGIIKAITEGKRLNNENIQKLVNNGTINLPTKREISRNLLIPGEDIEANQQIYYSALFNRIEGGSFKDELVVDSVARSIRYTRINGSIMTLYRQTLKYTSLPEPGNRIIYEIKDSARYFYFNKKYFKREFSDKTHYSYEAVLPLETAEKQLLEYMRADLNRYLNIYGRVEARLINCFVVIKRAGPNPAAVADKSKSNVSDKRTRNFNSIGDLLKWVNVYSAIPVIDETNSGVLTSCLEVPEDALSNIPELKVILNIYGFDINFAERKVDMFVLTDNN